MISKAFLASLSKLLVALVMGVGAVSLLLSRSSDEPSVQDGGRPAQDRERPAQDGGRLPVQVQQLSAHVAGNVLLRCENAHLSTPNEVADLVCYIRNNTSKQISAGALRISLTLDNQTNRHSSLLVFDTFVHPDYRAEHPNNLIGPGTEKQFADAVTTVDRPITGVSAMIDFIEFSDGTSLGPDGGSSRQLNAQRAGARKYKEWLAAKYDADRSADSLLRLISQGDSLPPDLPVIDPNERQGAKIFENHLRRLFQEKGAEGLTKHFKNPK